ncbi:MAG: DEAD/DEAH box helicase family protein [Bifidobacteriaceae bacterium]|jgi:type III restriction enzyme|nr:DEAD/DEAH box helicase family protein [Bifidobacteriaceae bacterium]
MENDDKIRAKNADLVLKVSENVDISVWDEGVYYQFVDKLCRNRKYQKEAIFTTLRYLLGGQYKNLEELAKENFDSSEKLKEVYRNNFDSLRRSLPFPNKLSASLDLATGTGKSYVLYALAAIMMSSGAVDQVLVVVPSVTIETELTKKFTQLAEDSELARLLLDTGMSPPRIINGSESITEGSICIENRDAVYRNARTSISDSLKDKGERTLLLNDEVHHIYNTSSNEWRKFINDEYENGINFKYVIGVSGTCYKGTNAQNANNYFSDVIYRYSLKTAIENNFAKKVEYIPGEELPSGSYEKWQVITKSHESIRNELASTYGELPISIVVARDIQTCKNVAKEFKGYLKERYGYSEDEVNEKVLVVHSNSDAASDRIKLKHVDEPENPVEWIFSVSMLTEGWDVKRVFQIIPHEERAFNSKLLIAQVMGRGLRIPDEWLNKWGDCRVRIFNHAKWAESIQRLVDEILEFELFITSVVDNNSPYNFELQNVNYSTTCDVIDTPKKSPYKWLEKEYITLPTIEANHEQEYDFTDVIGEHTSALIAAYSNKTFTIEDAARVIDDLFGDLDQEFGEEKINLTEYYRSKWNIKRLEKMIKLSLKKSGNAVITKELMSKIKQSVGTLKRTGNKTPIYSPIPNDYFKSNTKDDVRSVTVRASSLKAHSAIFWTDETQNFIEEEQKSFYDEVTIEVDMMGKPVYNQQKVANAFNFKTPQSLVIADSRPEVEFIKRLTDSKHNKNINKWIKSPSTGFYSIEYTWEKKTHHQKDSFNPDFFLIAGDRVIVAEVKDDEQIGDMSDENKGKWRAAIKHFKYINDYLKEQGSSIQYVFTMITPQSYEAFFNTITSDNVSEIDDFNSFLDAEMRGRSADD